MTVICEECGRKCIKEGQQPGTTFGYCPYCDHWTWDDEGLDV
jgi:hypothetical protein